MDTFALHFDLRGVDEKNIVHIHFYGHLYFKASATIESNARKVQRYSRGKKEKYMLRCFKFDLSG